MEEEGRYCYGQSWVDRRGRACRRRRHATVFHVFENEFPAPTVYEGDVYPSAFHAFQAARYASELRAPLRAADPGGGRAMSVHEARVYGARTDLPITPTFLARRQEIMRAILRGKFQTNAKMLAALLRTGTRQLVYDSACPMWGSSANKHGELLAAVRDELRVEVEQLLEAAQAEQSPVAEVEGAVEVETEGEAETVEAEGDESDDFEAVEAV
jgi:predicted NAD-dependent protein-ADP-ribosyltransferase YbiA (DUF1768 family)